jgi:hypothetical protein
MDNPSYCSSVFRTHVAQLVEGIQTASLRGSHEKHLLSTLSLVTSSCADIERSWRILYEREKTYREDISKETEVLKTRLIQCESEKNELKRKLEASRAALQLGKEEQKNDELELDARISRAILARNEELEQWKREYTSQMKSIVEKKVSEARQSSQMEYLAVLDASLLRLEREYKNRMEERQKALIIAENQAEKATRLAEALRLRAESAQQLKSTLETEKRIRESSESQIIELRERLQMALNEVNRLKDTVDVERRAHKTLLNIQQRDTKINVKTGDHLVKPTISDQNMSLRDLNDEKRRELAYAADIAFWKKKADDLTAKVVTIEALLKDLDSGIVTVKAD